MKAASRKKLLKYMVTAVVALAIALPVAVQRGLEWPQEAYLSARYLSDGFFVAGLIIGGIGLLVWISTTGFFDMFSYGFHSLLVLFSSLRKPKDHEHFYDYKVARDAKRGKPKYYLVIVGAVCVVLSLACLALYYKLPQA